MLTMKNVDEKPNKASVWEKCEIFINTANHCLIAITTFYLIWYCLQFETIFDLTSQHVLITTIGYQVLMAEGIMTFYKANSLTFLSSRNERKNIHWIMQVIGGCMGLYGCAIEVVNLERRGRHHFSTLHSLFGLASMVFLCISIVSGLIALFPFETRKFLKPVISKFSHNLLSVACFVTGMISLMYAWIIHNWGRTYDPGNLRLVTIWCIGFITLFTPIGALKSLGRHFSGIVKLLQRSSNKEVYDDDGEKQ